MDKATLFTSQQEQELASIRGDAGIAWGNAAPALVEACLARWRLTFEAVASGGYPTNLTLFVSRGEDEAVLKLGFPDPEQLTEIAALGFFDGNHAVNVLAADTDVPALLIERLRPGTQLRDLGDNAQESWLAANLMARLPAPVPADHNLPRVSEWLRRAFGTYQAAPVESRFGPYVDRAGGLFRTLQERSRGERLLHGDLHHENVLLDSARGWLAIDPKGVIGPAEFECGRFVHNFMDELDRDAMIACVRERAGIVAPVLGLSVREVLEITLIDLTMAMCWSFDSGHGDAGRGLLKLDVVDWLLANS